MPALTETEATARAALLDVASYDVFADLTAEPVRSRTEIRFGCREPGAATFTDPADDAGYLLFTGYPTQAPGLFCCFDQSDLIATTTLSLVLPAGWDCLT